MPTEKILYKGLITGTVICEPQITEEIMNFVIKSDLNIEGIPEEIVVRRVFINSRDVLFYFRKGDKVSIAGAIVETISKIWKKPLISIRAQSIYNETLKIEI